MPCPSKVARVYEQRVRAYWHRLWTEGDFSFAHEFYAPSFLVNGVERTPAQFARSAEAFRGHFDDMVVSVERVFLLDDGVVSRVRYRAHYSGGFSGLQVVGAGIDVTGLDVFRFEHGLVIEHLHEADHEALWEQLGVKLPPGD